MFTQEQLAGFRTVLREEVKPMIQEAIKPLEERFDRLEKKMDEGFEKMDEKIDNVEKSLINRMDTRFDKIEADINYMKGDIAVLLDTTANLEEKVEEIGGTMLALKDDMRRLKANSSIWVVREEGDDDQYTPQK